MPHANLELIAGIAWAALMIQGGWALAACFVESARSPHACLLMAESDNDAVRRSIRFGFDRGGRAVGARDAARVDCRRRRGCRGGLGRADDAEGADRSASRDDRDRRLLRPVRCANDRERHPIDAEWGR